MRITIPPWTLIPAALVVVGLWLAMRKANGWDLFTPVLALACFGGAALFLLGRCFA